MILVNGNVVDTAKGLRRRIRVDEDKANVVVKDLFSGGVGYYMHLAKELRQGKFYWYASKRAGKTKRMTRKAFVGKSITASGILKAQARFRRYDSEA